MNNSVKLFDYNGKLVQNFEEEIEKILISIHGDNYYDVDEELVNTNDIEKNVDDDLEKTMEFVDELVSDDAKEIKIVPEQKQKPHFKDFFPVLFFMIIACVIVFAGYYFLNTADLLSLLGLSS